MSEVPAELADRLAASAALLDGLDLEARASDSPPGLCLGLSGSLDGNNSHLFRDLTRAALGGLRGGESLVLDLEGLTYISSTGVGAFTTILGEARRREVSLLLRGMQDRVKAVFDVLGFSDFFTFADRGAPGKR